MTDIPYTDNIRHCQILNTKFKLYNVSNKYDRNKIHLIIYAITIMFIFILLIL